MLCAVVSAPKIFIFRKDRYAVSPDDFDFCLSITTRFDNKHIRSCLAPRRSVSGWGLVTHGGHGPPANHHVEPVRGSTELLTGLRHLPSCWASEGFYETTCVSFDFCISFFSPTNIRWFLLNHIL